MANNFALTLKAQNVHAASSVSGAVTHLIPDRSERVADLQSAVFEITGTSATNTIAIGGSGSVTTVLAGGSGIAQKDPITGTALAFTNYQGLMVSVGRADDDTAPGLAQAAVTSTTSLAIGTGSRAFTVASGLAFVDGQRVRAVSAANSANFMEGKIVYSTTTLTMTVDRVSGSGTLADWTLTGQIVAQITSNGFGGLTASTAVALQEDGAFMIYPGGATKTVNTETVTISLAGTTGLKVSVLALGN